MSPKGKAAIAVLSLLLGWTAWKGVHFVSSSPRVHISVPADSRESAPMKKIVQKSPEEWKKALTPAQYQVLIACGTEPPFSGIYDDFWESGGYHCAACGALLFRSETKYEHGTGWPSFFESASPGALERREDRSAGMIRTEIRCAACGGHLGHVFDDGPPPPAAITASTPPPWPSGRPPRPRRAGPKRPRSPPAASGAWKRSSAACRASWKRSSAIPEAARKIPLMNRFARTRPATPRPSG